MLSLWGSNSWPSCYSTTLYHTDTAPIPRGTKSKQTNFQHRTNRHLEDTTMSGSLRLAPINCCQNAVITGYFVCRLWSENTVTVLLAVLVLIMWSLINEYVASGVHTLQSIALRNISICRGNCIELYCTMSYCSITKYGKAAVRACKPVFLVSSDTGEQQIMVSVLSSSHT